MRHGWYRGVHWCGGALEACSYLLSVCMSFLNSCSRDVAEDDGILARGSSRRSVTSKTSQFLNTTVQCSRTIT